jgi:hypothetical protein
MQRKKCKENCVLAPYFPQEERHKFLLVHRVFGKAKVIKLLQVCSIALIVGNAKEIKNRLIMELVISGHTDFPGLRFCK